MGLFDFLKPKKSPLNEHMERLSNSMFPKGQKDIDAGTNELLFILKNKISRETAQGIFLKSIAISRISQKFDKERLRAHLAGYCLQHFSEQQLDDYYNYLSALTAAMLVHQRTPSEVRRQGDAYIW